MPTKPYTYCPTCGTALVEKHEKDRDRMVCPTEGCGFVHWNNPIPVVGAIVERDGKIVLVQSIGWPKHFFGLVTGFLEQGEMPDDAVLREVKEETGLDAEMGSFIGMYPFYRMNQLLLVYHVIVGEGEIKIDESELAAFKEVPIEKVRPWPAGTGIALRDWLRTRGFEREFIQF